MIYMTSEKGGVARALRMLELNCPHADVIQAKR